MLNRLLQIVIAYFLLILPVTVSAQAEPTHEVSPLLSRASYEASKPLSTINPKLDTIEPIFAWPNTYAWGNCTAFVASQVPVPDTLGNANTWDDRSPGKVNNIPTVGAIAQSDAGYYGHVAVVRDVKDGQVLIEEANVYGLGVVDTRWTSASEFKYIHYLWLANAIYTGKS